MKKYPLNPIAYFLIVVGSVLIIGCENQEERAKREEKRIEQDKQNT